jgi:hypothetical protein
VKHSRFFELENIVPRRFPAPWSVEEQHACFVVRDHNGQQLAYVYFEDEPGRRSRHDGSRSTLQSCLASNRGKMQRGAHGGSSPRLVPE